MFLCTLIFFSSIYLAMQGVYIHVCRTGNTNLIYSSNLWILIDINLGLYRYKNCRGIKDNWIL